MKTAGGDQFLLEKMAQLFSNGATSFEFDFKNGDERFSYIDQVGWNVFFKQGYFSIYNSITHMRIELEYPHEDHWVYTDGCRGFHCGYNRKGAIIKNDHFRLAVTVNEYEFDSQSHPKFDPKRDTVGVSSGHIDLETKGHVLTMKIPYNLALNRIKFMSGSPHLDTMYCHIK